MYERMRKYDNQLEDFFGINTGGTGAPQESIKDAIVRRLSLQSRLRLLPKVLSKTERYAVLGLMLLAIGSLVAIPVTSFYHYTEEVPATGGKLIEGIVGEPRLVNPLLSPSSDADRDLASLIYSGLYRYNGTGHLVPDLAESMPEITSDGLSYSVALREDAVWHDGFPVTADDVVFTVQTAQDNDYGAPSHIRGAWQGVEVQKASDHVVIFKIGQKYAQFMNNLTLGILPKHLWEDVKPINFNLSEYNMKPVGSGPFRFVSYTKDELGRVHAYKLESFDEFYEGRPLLDGIEFRFFTSEDELIEAYNTNEIDNIGFISAMNVDRLKFRTRVNLEQLKMPRYYGLFFNQNQSKALADKNVRLALNQGTDRIGIINETTGGNAFLINSPMLGGILDVNTNVRSYDFDPIAAAQVLTAGGWTAGEDGILQRSKDNKLELTITTSTFPELVSIAEQVKEQWEALGAKVTVQALSISELQAAFKERNYQILLFGELLQLDPDPFTLWHSSQRNEPGLNFALYSNKTADRLLEEARQTLNPLERREKYDEFQKILIEDIPAVFLFSPHYLYGLDRDVEGFGTEIIATPADRFTNARSWYTDTEREFK
jgi:peptide/nickel transport system substrate-binding protein